MRSGLSGADMMFLDLDVRSEVVVSGVVRILFSFFLYLYWCHGQSLEFLLWYILYMSGSLLKVSIHSKYYYSIMNIFAFAWRKGRT